MSHALTHPMRQPSLSELVEAALAAPARCGHTRVVLIDGPAGSGKTTLAARMGDALGAQILHADDMYEGWDGLPGLGDILVSRVFEPLARGDGAGFARWDWVASARAEYIGVPSAAVLVIEGVGVAQRKVRAYSSLIIFVDAPWETRLNRGVERDGESMRPEWERWQAAESPFLESEGIRESAHAYVDGTRPFLD